MYKKIFILLVVASVLWSVDTFSMTVVTGSREVKNTNPSVDTLKTRSIYLLDWQDKKLLTTKGTFYLSTDIIVINKSGLEKGEIALQKKSPVIKIDKVDRQVRVITILPNTQ